MSSQRINFCPICNESIGGSNVNDTYPIYHEWCDPFMNNEPKNGAYDLEGIIWHAHSPRLMIKLLELWPHKDYGHRIVDLGCGLNYYITVFNKAGYKSAFGIDAVDCGSRFAEVHDLTKPLPINQGVPMNVLSLEVGEHIDYEGSLIYLDNIAAVAQGGEVIMSWAIPGQAGHGHINNRSNNWVYDEMKARGYEVDLGVTHWLRESVDKCHCSWFKNTLMYFKPQKVKD